MPINAELIEFEALIELGSGSASRILGVSYPAYAKYRSGTRDLPLYHQRHIEVIGRMSRADLLKLIRDYAHAT